MLKSHLLVIQISEFVLEAQVVPDLGADLLPIWEILSLQLSEKLQIFVSELFLL